MNPLDETASRHAKLASDSVRVCVVFPKGTMDYVRGVAASRRVTISRIIREYVEVQMTREIKRCQTSRESA